MILIADSGSTKTTWSLVDKNLKRKDFTTEGYNPYYLSSEYIANSIRESLSRDILFHEITQVYFYGAGCEGFEKNTVLISLKILFENAIIKVDSDMVAAARALIGDGFGLACILGTGTNSCLFEDGKIIYQVESLGFLLGDEGSGAYLGKKLLSLYARKALPEKIMDRFYTAHKMLPNEILDSFYSSKLQNRYAASFSVFLKENIIEPSINSIVAEAFLDFFTNIISRYPDYENYQLNCVGSIAFIYQEILADVGDGFGISLGQIYRSPMDALCDYHYRSILPT